MRQGLIINRLIKWNKENVAEGEYSLVKDLSSMHLHTDIEKFTFDTISCIEHSLFGFETNKLYKFLPLIYFSAII